jgi:hypothetical protein
MTDLSIPNSNLELITPTIEQAGGFSASMIRKALTTANPGWTKKQIREGVNARLLDQQQLAHANNHEATRRGYRIVKQVTSVSGRITTVMVPPKADNRKISLSTLSLAEIEAELLRRRTLAVA